MPGQRRFLRRVAALPAAAALLAAGGLWLGGHGSFAHRLAAVLAASAFPFVVALVADEGPCLAERVEDLAAGRGRVSTRSLRAAQLALAAAEPGGVQLLVPAPSRRPLAGAVPVIAVVGRLDPLGRGARARSLEADLAARGIDAAVTFLSTAERDDPTDPGLAARILGCRVLGDPPRADAHDTRTRKRVQAGSAPADIP